MSRKTKLVLTERDREILVFVGQHETATLEQLRAKFWPHSITSATARDRLDKLRKSGYLQNFEYRPEPQMRATCFRLKRAALDELSPEQASELYTGNLEEGAIDEVVRGVDARLELEQLGYQVVEWISERRLLRNQQKMLAQARQAGQLASVPSISDGNVVILNPNTGQVEIIEVEIDGQYFGRMLNQKIAAFGDRRVYWAVSPSRLSRVTRAVAGHNNIQVIVI